MAASRAGAPRLSPAWIPALVLSVFAVAAFFWFSHVPRGRAEALAAWRRDLAFRADFRRDAIDAFLRERLADAKLVATFPAVQTLAASSARGPAPEALAHFAGVAREFRNAYGYDLVAVFDRSGALAPGSPESASDPGCRAAVRGVLEAGRPAAGMHVHAHAGPVLTVAAPVRDAAGALLGAVLAATSPAGRLHPLLGEPFTPRTGEAVLLARDGEQVVYLSPLRFRPNAPLAFRRPFETVSDVAREALEKPASDGLFVDYRGERVVAATRLLTAAPWGLVVKVDESEALEPFGEHVRSVALGWAAALAAALALAWGVGQRVRRLRAVGDARGEARFRTLLEQTTDAVLVVGADGSIQDANRVAEEMHGEAPGALLGRHVADLRPAEQRRAARAAFTASGRADRLAFAAEHVRADGTRFPVEISTRRAMLEGGPVHVSIVRDLGTKKRARDDAEA